MAAGRSWAAPRREGITRQVKGTFHRPLTKEGVGFACWKIMPRRRGDEVGDVVLETLERRPLNSRPSGLLEG